MQRETKFMAVFALFILAIMVSIVFGPKLVSFMGLTFSVSAFFYAFTFFCTDIMSECWGKEKTNKMVWIGFFAILLLTLLTKFSVWFPAAPFWLEQQEAFASVFGLVPRIFAGGCIAYLLSQLWDVHIFHKLRYKTSNKHLWLRNNVSTMTSQVIDTAIFVTIAFAGTVPAGVLFSLMWGQYLVKIAIAAIDTPLIYAARDWIGVPEELEALHR